MPQVAAAKCRRQRHQHAGGDSPGLHQKGAAFTTPPQKTEVCSLHPSHLASSSLAGRTRSDGFSDRTRAAKAPALCRKNVPTASAFGSTSRRQGFFVCFMIGHGEDFSEIRWCTIVEEIGLLTHITSVFEVWCADPVAGPPSIPMKIW